MALVISRHERESFTVDGPALITIERVQGGRVSVAVQAPRSTKILRSELKPSGEQHGQDPHQPGE